MQIRNTAENRRAFAAESRRLLLGFAAGVVVSALLFRWSLHETVEWLADGMRLIPGVVLLVSGFFGARACEVYFMLKAFDQDWMYVEDGVPRGFRYGLLRAICFVGTAAATGGFMYVVAKA